MQSVAYMQSIAYKLTLLGPTCCNMALENIWSSCMISVSNIKNRDFCEYS